MTRLTLLFLFISMALSSFAQTPEEEPLGINLEGYEYPYNTEFFTLQSQNQTLDMAYMHEEAEEPNGKTVLLFHGKNFNGAYWGQTMKRLLSEGFDVLVPDQVGFGKSSKPDYYHYTFQQLAKNTKTLMDSLGVNRTVVLGHSMGGMLATRFALMYPDNTSKLVLENPIGLEDWKRKVPYQGVETWYEGELGKTYKGVKEYMSASYYDNNWKAAYDEWLYLRTAFFNSPNYDRYAWNQALTTDMVMTQPVLYEFPELEMPVVLIIGQRDRTALGSNLVPDSVAATMGNYTELGKKTAEAIPHATLVELDSIGHLPHIENFDQFIRILLDNIQ
ncbi:alpha/beta fold hydrolase [Fodinibius salsisoli]|uniref:Alpha/beta hydrolase n=1 Tax=Fodinibius salsisoli TaxID=2820877 RepID=A0ABT3PRL9_9BACT|nr:alpha/beta hydrolase [Fodinibius salsisoli]MCW9708476.1 alpha/beta hydrolase [Fodinibius salsisoli]